MIIRSENLREAYTYFYEACENCQQKRKEKKQEKNIKNECKLMNAVFCLFRRKKKRKGEKKEDSKVAYHKMKEEANPMFT